MQHVPSDVGDGQTVLMVTAAALMMSHPCTRTPFGPPTLLTRMLIGWDKLGSPIQEQVGWESQLGTDF